VISVPRPLRRRKLPRLSPIGASAKGQELPRAPAA
jgi:hypothetical protein